MTTEQHQLEASRVSGAVAGGLGAGPHEQPQLFSTPQTTSTSDDHYTPIWLFNQLQIEFDLDVACPLGGVPWVPAKHYYTQLDNGLTSPWFGRVWMNPPFSNTQPWVEKWIKHANGIALLPCVKHSRWVQTLWNSSAKVVWINQTEIKFNTATTEKTIWPIVWLWAIGQNNINAISKLGTVR